MNTQRVANANYVFRLLAQIVYEEWVWYPNEIVSEAYLDANGRMLKDIPWTDNGCQLWDISRADARSLSSILRKRGEGPFVYDANSRSWFVNLEEYPTLEEALAYFVDEPVTEFEWQSVR